MLGVSPSLVVHRNGGSAKLAEEGQCRMCLRPPPILDPWAPEYARKLTRHHLIPQSWFRARSMKVRQLSNADANIVPLCRRCHDDVEDDEAARKMLRKVLTQAEVAFVIQMLGQEWIDRRYPPPRRRPTT